MSEPSPEKTRIALIDDSELLLEIFTDVMTEAGFEPICLSSPVGASIKLAQEKPALVLVDLKLGSHKGEQIVEMLRASGRLGRCRIVLFSDSPPDVLREAAERCGADGFICKPDDPSRLVLKIKTQLL